MFTLMMFLGNQMICTEYPDSLAEAMNMAHDVEANNFILTGDGLTMRGSIDGNKITWKKQ